MTAAGRPGGPGGQDGPRAVVIGVGSEFRQDDGVGLRVLDRLRAVVPAGVRLLASDGEPAGLIEAWAGADLVIVVDAIVGDRSGQATPGRTHRLVIDQVEAEPVRAVSSHGLGLGEAVGLARALGRMPGRLIIHAVEVAETGYGTHLTPAVAAAADSLVAAVLADLPA